MAWTLESGRSRTSRRIISTSTLISTDYFEAKATLFDGRSRVAVIVTDDEWGRRSPHESALGAITVARDRQPHGDLAGHRHCRRTDATTKFRAVGPAELRRRHGHLGSSTSPTRCGALAVLDAVASTRGSPLRLSLRPEVPGRMAADRRGSAVLVVVG